MIMSQDRVKVAVLGAGAGGCALAFHLKQLGYEIILYQDKEHLGNLDLLVKNGFIEAVENVKGHKLPIHGVVEISFTSDIKQAVQFSDILIMCLPAFAQVTVFKSALPFLTSNHIFVSMPGNFAIFDYLKTIKDSGLKIDDPLTHVMDVPLPCVFVESSMIPYACRKLKDNVILIGGVKMVMHVGVYPEDRAENTFLQLDRIFQESIGLKIERVHLLETPFYNGNVVLHSVISVCNAGQIKCDNILYLYKDGISNLVCNLMGSLGKEISKIGNSLGFHLESFSEYYPRYYGVNESKDLEDFFKQANNLHAVKAPQRLTQQHRFIFEDLQYALLFMTQIAKQKKILTPIADSLIVLVQSMLGCELCALRKCPQEEMDFLINDRIS